MQSNVGIIRNGTELTEALKGLDELAQLLGARVPGVTHAKRVDSTVQLGVKGSHGVLPAVVTAAEQGGFTVTDLSLAETTLDPRNRTLLQVHIDSLLETDRTFVDLLGKDPTQRQRFVMEKAPQAVAEDLDV